MRMAGVLHEESSSQLLELIRQNWSMILSHNKGAIALDDFCKTINLWTKLLLFTPYFERLVKRQSIYLWPKGVTFKVGKNNGSGSPANFYLLGKIGGYALVVASSSWVQSSWCVG
jgi:hypothetical protein